MTIGRDQKRPRRMNMQQVTVKMDKLKETKGTVVYAGQSAKDNANVRQLYIQNEVFDGQQPPASIEVIIKGI